MQKKRKKFNKQIFFICLIGLMVVLLFSYLTLPTESNQQNNNGVYNKISINSLVDFGRVAGISDVEPTELSDNQSSRSGFANRTMLIIVGSVIAAVAFVGGLYYAVTRLLSK